ncbi:MAG: hypothetical protein RIB93_06635 [Coleofasciculus sp. D1-CHI-01]|uniref:Uncharacterized protein n=1 Tax=Coleofasciculus chthonoplastes PCC 7420 TaxID=118168 RepID=B4W170_9CYAN|nr:hypothetical protein [Coleofasciculus chthonoplastes]EDX72030.1 hypothetical protein MC7420_7510 [Coleofasciculus chthonoplastes PCC 7420]
MAKRRNLKKEKASRNQAYARQFRKKSSSSSFSRNKRYFGNRDTKNENENEGEEKEAE